jgi:hypothetical protein
MWVGLSIVPGLVLAGALAGTGLQHREFSKKPTSAPLAPLSSPSEEIVDGRISVHPVVMQQAQGDTKRLDFNDLLQADKVFTSIASSTQALGSSSSSSQTTVAVAVNGSAAAATVAAGPDDAGADAAPSAAPLPAPPSAAGLSSAYHDLLYATADTILGGETLKDIYNVEAIPNHTLFVVPIVASVAPGHATREGYTAEARLTFNCPKEVARGNFNVLAVAPAGFTRIVTQTSSMLRQLGFGTSVSLPTLSKLTAEGSFSQLTDQLDQLAQIVGRPDFQVTIESASTVRIRFLGREKFKGGVALESATYDTEVLILAKSVEACEATPAHAANAEAAGDAGGETDGPARAFLGLRGDVRHASAAHRLGYGVEYRFVPYFPLGSCPEGETGECAAYRQPQYQFHPGDSSDPGDAGTTLLAYENAPGIDVTGAFWEEGGSDVVISGEGFDTIDRDDARLRLCATVYDRATPLGEPQCTSHDERGRDPTQIVVHLEKANTTSITERVERRLVTAKVEVVAFNEPERPLVHYSVTVLRSTGAVVPTGVTASQGTNSPKKDPERSEGAASGQALSSSDCSSCSRAR